MAITASTLYVNRSRDGFYPFLGSTHWTPKGTWDDTSSYIKSNLSKYKRDDTQTFNATLGSNTTQPYKSLVELLVSDPLEAEASYSATLDVILGVLASTSPSTPNTLYYALHVWVSQGDTNTVRTTLLSNYAESGTAWPSSAAGQGLDTPQSISGSWQKGDRLVIEIGFVQRTVPGGSVSGAIYRGSDKDDTDLTAGNTSVTTKNGIFTFTSALTFASPDNTDVANAVDLTGDLPFDTVYGLQYALQEVGISGELREPYNSNFDTEINFLWYKYTPDFTGTLFLSTEGSGGASIRADVFEGYTAAQLKTSTPDGDTLVTAVDPTDDIPLEIPVTSGTPIFIRFGFDEGGTITLGDVDVKVQATPFGEAEPPPNEACEDAVEIIDLPFAITVNSLGSTIDVNTPCGTLYNTVWYKYKPTVDMMAGMHTANTEVFVPYGGSYRPVLIGIYQSNSPDPDDCSNLVLMKCAQGGMGYKFLAGHTYFLAFGSNVDGGYTYLNIYIFPHQGEFSENFNEFVDDDQLFGGDYYLDYYNNNTFGVLSPVGWGPDGSRAIKGIGCVGGSPFCVAKQTTHRNGLLVMDGPYGYVEADLWVGITDEPQTGSPGFFSMGVLGQWDPSNRNELDGGPDWTVKPLQLVDSNTIKGFTVMTYTPGGVGGGAPVVENEITLFVQLADIDGPSKNLRYHFDPPIFIDDYVHADGTYHHWKLAWRMSTHIAGEPQADGIVELYVDGDLLGRLCNVILTTDIGDQWNCVYLDPHGAVDNVHVSDQNIVTPCDEPCPCPPKEPSTAPGAGGREPPPTAPFEDFPPPDCEVLGMVPVATDPNLGESWCE